MNSGILLQKHETNKKKVIKFNDICGEVLSFFKYLYNYLEGSSDN